MQIFNEHKKRWLLLLGCNRGDAIMLFALGADHYPQDN